MKLSSLLSISLALLVGVQACSCSKSEREPAGPDTKDTLVVINPPAETDTVPEAAYEISMLEKCKVFDEDPSIINLERQDYQELSGIASSRRYTGVLYTHEDSGNSNEVFITDVKGDDLGKIVLDGVYNRDWEDIASGPGPDPAKKYLYVAEIGDNDANYPGISVLRFEEPDIEVGSSLNLIHITPEKLQFIYPQGPANAESLLLDPVTKDLYIATKENGRSTLFVAGYPQPVTGVTTLKPLAKLPFDLLTSGDISADGTEILLRNTGQIWYWKRASNETIAQTVLRKPEDAPYVKNEHQGEGICFLADGTGYFTNSETKKFPGDQTAISFYKRR